MPSSASQYDTSLPPLLDAVRFSQQEAIATALSMFNRTTNADNDNNPAEAVHRRFDELYTQHFRHFLSNPVSANVPDRQLYADYAALMKTGRKFAQIAAMTEQHLQAIREENKDLRLQHTAENGQWRHEEAKVRKQLEEEHLRRLAEERETHINWRDAELGRMQRDNAAWRANLQKLKDEEQTWWRGEASRRMRLDFEEEKALWTQTEQTRLLRLNEEEQIQWREQESERMQLNFEDAQRLWTQTERARLLRLNEEGQTHCQGQELGRMQLDFEERQALWTQTEQARLSRSNEEDDLWGTKGKEGEHQRWHEERDTLIQKVQKLAKEQEQQLKCWQDERGNLLDTVQKLVKEEEEGRQRWQDDRDILCDKVRKLVKEREEAQQHWLEERGTLRDEMKKLTQEEERGEQQHWRAERSTLCDKLQSLTQEKEEAQQLWQQERGTLCDKVQNLANTILQLKRIARGDFRSVLEQPQPSNLLTSYGLNIDADADANSPDSIAAEAYYRQQPQPTPVFPVLAHDPPTTARVARATSNSSTQTPQETPILVQITCDRSRFQHPQSPNPAPLLLSTASHTPLIFDLLLMPSDHNVLLHRGPPGAKVSCDVFTRARLELETGEVMVDGNGRFGDCAPPVDGDDGNDDHLESGNAPHLATIDIMRNDLVWAWDEDGTPHNMQLPLGALVVQKSELKVD